MAKFKFRMATSLKLRESVRDQRMAELNEAYRADDVLREKLEALQAEWNFVRDEFRRVVGPGKVNVDQLLESQRYEMTLLAQQAQVKRQREMVAEEIERRRGALMAANRDVKVLEKLRDKQAERFRLEEIGREAKRLDEVAQVRACATWEEVEL